MAVQVYTRSAALPLQRDPALRDMVKAELIQLTKQQQDIIDRQQASLTRLRNARDAALECLVSGRAGDAMTVLQAAGSGAS